MANSEYQAVAYAPEFKPAVAELLRGLWSNDPTENLSYFKWKYEDNPYTESPLGIVVLHDGDVVGYRGYFACRFEVRGKNGDISILIPCDTCVSPAHRRQGLSVVMGNLAKKKYAGQHSLFLNMTCTHKSLPGYQRMGFLPLANKVFLTQASLLGSAKYIRSDRSDVPLDRSRVAFGRFGEIEVSAEPRAIEMAAISAEDIHDRGRIRLFQDEQFFRWRFRNPRRKYVFYYLLDGDRLTGYVVVGLSANNRRGFILDSAQTNEIAIETILKYITRARHLDVLSIYEFCLEPAFANNLKRLGFSRRGLIRTLERRLDGELPLLIRPIQEIFTDEDLFIEGLDAREIENWSLKPICSDGA